MKSPKVLSLCAVEKHSAVTQHLGIAAPFICTSTCSEACGPAVLQKLLNILMT